MFPRRQPALALWGLIFLLFGIEAEVWRPLPDKPDFVPTEQDLRIEKMAKVSVERSLEVIGHGVRVSSVRVAPPEAYAAAWYWPHNDSVEFSSDVFFPADRMLHTAAHESVHALFDQAELNPYSESPVWDSRLVVEETAATVLGAHIAGRVRTLQGGDGDALTRRLVTEYRTSCDVSNPGGLRNWMWAFAHRIEFDWLDREFGDSLAVHHGPVEMVDAIDQICREHPDPWDAAHVIAERFIEPIPEPVVSGHPTP